MEAKKIIVGLIILILSCVLFFKVFAGDTFISVVHDEIPLPVKDRFEKVYITKAESELLMINSYSSKRHIGDEAFYLKVKNKILLKSYDVISFQYVDSNYIIVSTGPVSFDSGLRFFLLPNYEYLYIIETKKQKILHKYFFTGEISNAVMYNDSLYLEFAETDYGVKKIR